MRTPGAITQIMVTTELLCLSQISSTKRTNFLNIPTTAMVWVRQSYLNDSW